MSGLSDAEREALCICAALSPPLDHDTVKAICVERMAQSEAILAARLAEQVEDDPGCYCAACTQIRKRAEMGGVR